MWLKNFKTNCLVICLGVLFSTNVYSKIEPQQIDLLTAIDLALQQNTEFLSEKYQFEADKEVLEQAWSALKPNISFTHIQGYSQYNTQYFSDLDERFERNTLRLVQPIYSPKRLINLSRAKKSVESANTQFHLNSQSVLLSVAEAYIQLTKQKQSAELARQELNDYQLRVQRIDKMLQRGLSTKMDLLEAQAAYDDVASELIAIENEVKVFQTQLSKLVGQHVNEISSLPPLQYMNSNVLIETDHWFEILNQQSMEVSLAEQELELAEIEHSSQKSGHLPELLFRAELTRNDSYDSSITIDKKWLVEMNVPLYSGGGINSKTRAAFMQLKSKEHNLEEVKRTVEVELEEALAKLEGSLAKISAQERSLNSSKAYLQAAEKGMQYGLRGVFDVLEAKSRVYNAERKLAFETLDNVYLQFEFLYVMGWLNRDVIEQYLQINSESAPQFFINLSNHPLKK